MSIPSDVRILFSVPANTQQRLVFSDYNLRHNERAKYRVQSRARCQRFFAPKFKIQSNVSVLLRRYDSYLRLFRQLFGY